MVIEMYGLERVKDLEDVYSRQGIDEVLQIKTHYESLDISGSNKIYYLSFRLPATIPDRDEELRQLIMSNTIPEIK